MSLYMGIWTCIIVFNYTTQPSYLWICAISLYQSPHYIIMIQSTSPQDGFKLWKLDSILFRIRFSILSSRVEPNVNREVRFPWQLIYWSSLELWIKNLLGIFYGRDDKNIRHNKKGTKQWKKKKKYIWQAEQICILTTDDFLPDEICNKGATMEILLTFREKKKKKATPV